MGYAVAETDKTYLYQGESQELNLTQQDEVKSVPGPSCDCRICNGTSACGPNLPYAEVRGDKLSVRKCFPTIQKNCTTLPNRSDQRTVE